jgi:cyclopropane-fatty-acyl-phospholipid synthase
MNSSRPGVAGLVEKLTGPDLPFAVEAYDGSRVGPADPPATVRVRSPLAVQRVLGAPGELGFARAYVAGDLDVEGDIYAVLSQRDLLIGLPKRPTQLLALARLSRLAGFPTRPPAPPKEEVRLNGWLHSRSRDAAAIAHHYDISNDFYRLILGPTMTYSCGVWERPTVGLDAAQEAKYELIARKLDLAPGQRLLDIGCGWGGMLIHAARHHGVRAIGVTISRPQAELARQRVAEAGLADQVEIRLADYRDVTDGPFDAISSIGMFEHVGQARLDEYFTRLRDLLRPGGRLLNHGISNPTPTSAIRSPGAMFKRSFIDRYIFPDGELHEIGSVVSRVQRAGLEVRHVESLREHYALTLRAWVANLEQHWQDAVAAVGATRARIWRLYLAGSALGFEVGEIQIHQTLAVRAEQGRSEMSSRPTWDSSPLTPPQVAQAR